MNSFGKIFRWTSFGESHGPAMGVVIDGCPAGVKFDEEEIHLQLQRRRPGQQDQNGHVIVTDRNEKEEFNVLSGVFEGKTLGTPITIVVANKDQRSQDYDKSKVRVGHADDMWSGKFEHSDYRGGGRSSGRETLSRVLAGAVAKMLVTQIKANTKVFSFISSISDIRSDVMSISDSVKQTSLIEKSNYRFYKPGFDLSEFLTTAKSEGESYGGVIETWLDNIEPYLGEPVFYKFKSALASAMMSIGATTGFEFGGGFKLSQTKGTVAHTDNDSQVYGGLRGGITTGERVTFKVAFKPTSSIKDTAKKGRHDPCIVPRALPVVEAMVWALLADFYLLRKLNVVKTDS